METHLIDLNNNETLYQERSFKEKTTQFFAGFVLCAFFGAIFLLFSDNTTNSIVFVKETFNDGNAWTTRWVQSKNSNDYGKFKLTPGKDKGIQTSQDDKFYAISRKMDKTFDNYRKTLVLQFSVKHEQTIECGGGYVKILPKGTDLTKFNGEDAYYVMFGPNICHGKKNVVVNLRYRGKIFPIKKDVPCKDDGFTHVYTLIIRPNNTFEILIDNQKVESGDLESSWDFLPPKKIKDPEGKNPKLEIDIPILYHFSRMKVIGIEIWQSKAGTIFDDILVTDDVDYAKKFAKDTWGKKKDAEKKMKKLVNEKYKKKKEEEDKKRKDEEDSKKDKDEDKDDEDEKEAEDSKRIDEL